MTEEIKCPCERASRANCTECQDVPIWYFDEPAFEDVKREDGHWEREYKNETQS